MVEAAVAVEAAKPSQPSLGDFFGTKPVVIAPEKTVIAEASPQKEKPAAEVKEEKPEASPAAEAKPEEKPSLDAKKEEAKPKEEAKSVVEAKKEEPSKPVVSWEAEKETLNKQLKDTRDYATRVNRENLELKKQFEIINKKLDGTYDPAIDEPQVPPPQEVLSNGQLIGKVGASLTAAIELYGEETVEKEINEFHQLFEENPIIQQRVKSAELPAVEALKVMKEYRFIQKNGPNPDKWEENIRKAVIEELTPKIRAEESQKLMARLDKKDKEIAGLGGVRGSNGIQNEKATPVHTPLSNLFNG